MIFRVRTTVVVLCASLIGATPAWAQRGNGDLPIEREAEAQSAQPAFTLAKDLDGLFDQLARTRDDSRGKRISARIWEKFRESDSRSVDLLSHWARAATERKDYGVALDLLDQVVTIRPRHPEGWNQRAILHYEMRNYRRSIADIERTLALEPRHFGALSGLANILTILGRKREALEAWYAVLKVYPAMQSAQDAVIKLEEELAGRKS